jgi:hypothetical protein
MVTYKGVHKIDSEQYEARIFKDGRETRIGIYASDVEAAIAYDITAEAALGDFANLNFPERFVAGSEN